MRQFLTVVLILAAIWGGVKFYNYAKSEVAKDEQPTDDRYAPGKLPGLPKEMEPALAAAQQAGAASLKNWLTQNRSEITDPRLTEIELDYVVLVGRTNPTEARRELNQIKQRIKPQHPQYKRFQELDQAYP